MKQCKDFIRTGDGEGGGFRKEKKKIMSPETKNLQQWSGRQPTER